MPQQHDELEEHIGYRFHNREHLYRALTCQSAINERHPNATKENFGSFAFLGDAVLKYVVARLLYTEQNGFTSREEFHNRVNPYIINSKSAEIGRGLNLSKYIIKGKGVTDVTSDMLSAAVEAILGAIVIDQQEQGINAENALFDVIARVFSIQRKDKLVVMPSPQNNGNKQGCSCCKCFLVILVIPIVAMLMFSVFNRV